MSFFLFSFPLSLSLSLFFHLLFLSLFFLLVDDGLAELLLGGRLQKPKLPAVDQRIHLTETGGQNESKRGSGRRKKVKKGGEENKQKSTTKKNNRQRMDKLKHSLQPFQILNMLTWLFLGYRPHPRDNAMDLGM